MRVLQTERLELRWFTDADAPFILQMLNEPSWLQHIGDRQVRSAEQALEWLQSRLISGYWRQGMGFWAVCLQGQPEPLGLCGLIQRDTLPDVDVGYAFLPRHWGQGYAREAAQACLRYGHEALGLSRILAITGPENGPSQRLLLGLGMQLEQRCTLAGESRETLVYAWGAAAQQSTASGANSGTGGSSGTDAGFSWSAATATETATSDEAQILALTQRFLNLFDNRNGAVPRLPCLPALCLPDVRIVMANHGAPQTLDLPSFMQPRAALFSQGRLVAFHEWETQGQTQIVGHMAQRWLRCAKQGLLDGQPCDGEGHKSLQFVRTAKGWRICSVLWQEATAN